MEHIFTNNPEKNDILLDALNSFDLINNIAIASPFLMNNAFLDKLINNNCEIKIIIRLCSQTDYNALEKLIKYGASIKYFIDDNFHSKLYLINKSYAIVGSSNFTNGGLKHNKEINIGFTSNDLKFEFLTDLFEEYWNEAFVLSWDEMNIIKEITLVKAKKTNETSFDDLLKRKINKLNSEKLERSLASQHQKEAVRASLSKAVVCLNNGNRYNSLKEAAIGEYKNVRGYDYISAVCKGEKNQYKGYVWRFEEDYSKLKQDEIERLIYYEIKEQPIIKYMIDNSIYKSQSGVLKHLKENYNFNTDRQNLNEKIIRSRNMNIPVIKQPVNYKDVYIYFSEYIQITKNKVYIDEKPIGKTLEEIKNIYEPITELYIGGGCGLIEAILSADSQTFYKIDGEYYRNKQYINTYDRELTAEEVYELKNNDNYTWNFSPNEINFSDRKKYYEKNEFIFKNANDYIDKHIEELSKKEFLHEINIKYNIDYKDNE